MSVKPFLFWRLWLSFITVQIIRHNVIDYMSRFWVTIKFNKNHLSDCHIKLNLEIPDESNRQLALGSFRNYRIGDQE